MLLRLYHAITRCWIIVWIPSKSVTIQLNDLEQLTSCGLLMFACLSRSVGRESHDDVPPGIKRFKPQSNTLAYRSFSQSFLWRTHLPSCLLIQFTFLRQSLTCHFLGEFYWSIVQLGIRQFDLVDIIQWLRMWTQKRTSTYQSKIC